jgi:hypothetical protein
MSKNEIALTKVRRETLIKLRNGWMMEIDSMNLASINGEPVAPVTRYFLTDKRLVERKDKSKAVTTKGNGYIISAKGLKILESSK